MHKIVQTFLMKIAQTIQKKMQRMYKESTTKSVKNAYKYFHIKCTQKLHTKWQILMKVSIPFYKVGEDKNPMLVRASKSCRGAGILKINWHNLTNSLNFYMFYGIFCKFLWAKFSVRKFTCKKKKYF